MNLNVFPAFTAAQHTRVIEAMRDAYRLAIVGESADTVAWSAFNALRAAGIAAFPPSPNEQPMMTRATIDGVRFCAIPDPTNGRIRLVAA